MRQLLRVIQVWFVISRRLLSDIGSFRSLLRMGKEVFPIQAKYVTRR
jgi:hypothetical protein